MKKNLCVIKMKYQITMSNLSFITGTAKIICRQCGIKTTHLSIDDNDYFCKECGLYKNSSENYYNKVNKIESGYEKQNMTKSKLHNIKAKRDYYEKINNK